MAATFPLRIQCYRKSNNLNKILSKIEKSPTDKFKISITGSVSSYFKITLSFEDSVTITELNAIYSFLKSFMEEDLSNSAFLLNNNDYQIIFGKGNISLHLNKDDVQAQIDINSTSSKLVELLVSLQVYSSIDCVLSDIEKKLFEEN